MTTPTLAPLTPSQREYLDGKLADRLTALAAKDPHISLWLRAKSLDDAIQDARTPFEKADAIALLIVASSAIHFHRVTPREILREDGDDRPEVQAMWQRLNSYKKLLIRRIVIGLERAGEFRKARAIHTEKEVNQ